MNIVSFQDYQDFITHVVSEIDDRKRCVLSLVCAQFLCEKYALDLHEDLTENEISTSIKLLECIWDIALLKRINNEEFLELKKKFFSIGLYENDDPAFDLSSACLDALSAIELADKCQIEPSIKNVVHCIGLIIDGVDRELDEKYSNYMVNSLEKMFTYQEMKDALAKILHVIACLNTDANPRVLSKKLA